MSLLSPRAMNRVAAECSGQATDAVEAGRELRFLGSRRDPGPDRVEIDVDTTSQERRLIEQRLRFEPAGPESSRRALLVIGLAGDPFAQAPHEPGKARQPGAQNRQAIGIGGQHGHVVAVGLAWVASQLVALRKELAQRSATSSSDHCRVTSGRLRRTRCR